jgi:predicted polyphosphate/ATP-dependent NAD kinase
MARDTIGATAHRSKAAAGSQTIRVPTIGVIANPLAGKDIRRLIAHASPTSDGAKIGIVRRLVAGAIEGGARHILLAPDNHRLCERAVERLDLGDATVEVLDIEFEGTRDDTIASAAALAERGVGAVAVLGGDGTHRDVAKGWLNAPMIAISTGTNNVFPRSVDATVAGLAAGLVAAGTVRRSEAASQASVIHASVSSGATDLALVDVGVMSGSFAGSRAVWRPEDLRAIISCINEPDTVGLASVGARLAPQLRSHDGGTYVSITSPDAATSVVRAPITPGVFTDLPIDAWRSLALEEAVTLTGPCVLSFDGERDVVLDDEESATLVIRRDGPWVINPTAALTAATSRSAFTRNVFTRPVSLGLENHGR